MSGLTYHVDSADALSVGNLLGQVGTVDLDSSYPTGGYPLDLEKLTGRRFYTKMSDLRVDPKSGLVFEVDYDNMKLKAMRASGAAHTHAVTLANHTHEIFGSNHHHAVTVSGDAETVNTADTNISSGITGNGGAATVTSASGGGSGSAAALVEVSNGVDLSAVTGVHFVVMGY